MNRLVLNLLLAHCLTVGWPANAAGDPLRVALVDAGEEPVANAIIVIRGPVDLPVEQSMRRIVDQYDRRFVPRVAAVQVGGEVEFRNSDTFSHHVYSFSRPNAFELPLYPGGERPVRKFEHPGLVTLGCNIHDTMVGYLMVVDTPYFAVTNSAGVAEFADWPAAGPEPVFAVWHPDMDTKHPTTIPKTAIAAGAHDLHASIRLSEDIDDNSAQAGSSLSWDDY